MPQVKINDVQYHYDRWGTGIPLVALHGFTGSTANWKSVAAHLHSGIELVAIDLLGHGRTEKPSAWPRYAMEHVAQDILAIIEHLDLNRVNLLGYSMGGRLALYTARANPTTFATLILESASPGINNAEEQASRRRHDGDLADSIESSDIEAFVDLWEELPLFASQKHAPRQKKVILRQQRLQNDTRGIANSLRGMGTGSQPSLWPALPYMHTPTLLLCGALDDKYVKLSKEMERLMPEVQLTIVADAGHNIHFEQTELYAAVVSEFITNIHELNNERTANPGPVPDGSDHLSDAKEKNKQQSSD